MIKYHTFFFFFSSRRRHTRYWRDWSSDVCSSDLTPRPTVTREWELAVRLEGTDELPMVTLDGAIDPSTGAALTLALWTAAASAAPVSYVDLDGLAYSVYVQDVREQIADISQRTGLQRLGLVTLVEAA